MAEVVYGGQLDAKRGEYLRRHFQSRLEGMRLDRMSFWQHWASLAEMFLPRRYKWFVTPNQSNRGSQLNQSIIDETGILAARICASGMMSGLTSPIRPWFKLGFNDIAFVEFGPAKVWLAEVERRMLRVFAESNFYQALATLYHDNGVFGSAAMLIYDDPDEVIRCYNPALGEFFFGASARLDIDALYREFPMTSYQLVQEFGLKNVSTSMAQKFQQGGTGLTVETIVQHGVEPNFPLYEPDGTPCPPPVPESFAYRECYWEVGQNYAQMLRVKGFNEKPFVGARWDIVSNDAYGRSPGMDALPATRQLQVEQRRKGEAIDKLVRPPMVASVSMKNEPNSILPGSVNYVADVAGSGFKPAYQVDPRIAEMVEDIREIQGRIKSIFFVDLFLMISELDTVRTATEIDARREEKLIQLGPVIERFQNEVLDPLIERTFAIMERRGLIPEPPPEIAGVPINVQYTSMLAAAQRAASSAGIERWVGFGGNLAAVDPTVMDNFNLDAASDEMADLLEVNPKLVRPQAEVAALRAARQKAQQQAALLAQTAPAVDAAKTLSEIDVGGGQSALSRMIQ